MTDEQVPSPWEPTLASGISSGRNGAVSSRLRSVRRRGVGGLRWLGSVVGGRLAAVRTTWPTERARQAADFQDGSEADLPVPYWHDEFQELFEEFRLRFGRDPAILEWHTGLELMALFESQRIFSPPTAPEDPRLPYLDRTIDIVVVTFPDSAALTEARRVTSAAVATLGHEDDDEAEYPALDVEWLSGAELAEVPTTSIVIPSYNCIDLTKACLEALQVTLPDDFKGEIIVVDDGSTDHTWTVLKRFAKQDDRVELIQNDENLGFIESCNRGAAQAKGDLILFLNQDTVPLPGWLPSLHQTFRQYPDAGAVGGMLVYPDGTLQEAGGIIFSDGSGANFGRGDDPDNPLYNYVREVDYCSGAFLATPRSLFLALGGFDIRYRPAYYEDTDYCFNVREHGYRVYYQPECVVIHHEGSVSGTDLLSGTKRFQVINREKFVEKWRAALTRQPMGLARFDRGAWYTLAVREERMGVDGDDDQASAGMRAADSGF